MTPDEERRAEKIANAKERGALMREYLRTSTHGMEVGLSVVVGALLGRWLDGKLDTAPWCMWAGLFFGCIAAGRKLYRIVKREQRRSTADG